MLQRVLCSLVSTVAVLSLSACLHAGEEPGKPTAADKALVEQAKKLAAEVADTPAREMANRLNKEMEDYYCQWLLGKREVSEAKLEKARKGLRDFIAFIKRGPNWPEAKTFGIPRVAAAPTVDGELGDACWQNALTLDTVYPFNSTENVGKPATVWRILWDETNLYFAFDCADDRVVAPELERDDTVFFHDCVEMFICPSRTTGMYWEIVVGPTGSIFDALHAKKFHQFGAVGRAEMNMEGLRIGTKVRAGENPGYSVEVAVPFAALPEYSRAKPAPGQELWFMLVRLDKQGEDDPFGTYAFVPLLNWGHNIWNHQRMILAE